MARLGFLALLAALLAVVVFGVGGATAHCTPKHPHHCPTPTPTPTVTPTPTPDPNGWTFCAAEWARCSFTGTQEVRYGAGTTYTAPRTFTDGVDCTNAVFGDPLPGTPKHCDRRPVTTPPPTGTNPGTTGNCTTGYTFCDDFDGSAIDSSKWGPIWWGNSPDGRFVLTSPLVSDSAAHLKMECSDGY